MKITPLAGNPKPLLGKWNQHFIERSDLPSTSPASLLSPEPQEIQSTAAPSSLTKLQPSSRHWIRCLGPRGRAELQAVLAPLGDSSRARAGLALLHDTYRHSPSPHELSAYTVLLFQQRRPEIHGVLHAKTGLLSAIYTQIPAPGMPCKDIFLTIKKVHLLDLRGTDFLSSAKKAKKNVPSAPASEQDIGNAEFNTTW